MKRITTWSPDTCNCVIEYEWDDTEDQNTRKHKFVKVDHCGDNHPQAVVGEQVENSNFHKHHTSHNKNRGGN